MKQKNQVSAPAKAIFGLLILVFLVVFIGSIAPVQAQAACDINDFSQSNAIYTVTFQPSSIKATTNFTAKGTVTFKATATEARCKNQGFVFEFAYSSTGDSIVKAPVQVQAEQALIDTSAGTKWGYQAVDTESWSGLTQKSTLGSSAVLSLSLNIVGFGGQTIDGASIKQLTVQPDPVAPGGASADSSTTAGGPAGSATGAAAGSTSGTSAGSAASSADCVKNYGTGYVAITGTTICVPQGPGNGNGIAGSDSIFKVIATVIRILLILSGALAVLFVIIGGFWYLTSAGNEEQAAKGRKALTYAILGLVIIVLSYAIVAILIRTLTSTPDQIISGGGSSTTSGGPGGTNPGGGPGGSGP